MSLSQPGIIAPVPSLRHLTDQIFGDEVVIAFGPGLVHGIDRSIQGLRPFPALSGPGCEIPSTQADIWCWI